MAAEGGEEAEEDGGLVAVAAIEDGAGEALKGATRKAAPKYQRKKRLA